MTQAVLVTGVVPRQRLRFFGPLGYTRWTVPAWDPDSG